MYIMRFLFGVRRTDIMRSEGIKTKLGEINTVEETEGV
jgi:hypothetical protein